MHLTRSFIHAKIIIMKFTVKKCELKYVLKQSDNWCLFASIRDFYQSICLGQGSEN